MGLLKIVISNTNIQLSIKLENRFFKNEYFINFQEQKRGSKFIIIIN